VTPPYAAANIQIPAVPGSNLAPKPFQRNIGKLDLTNYLNNSTLMVVENMARSSHIEEDHYDSPTPQLVMRTGPTLVRPTLSARQRSMLADISNDIAVNEAELSRKHARLTLQGENFVLEDWVPPTAPS